MEVRVSKHRPPVPVCGLVCLMSHLTLITVMHFASFNVAKLPILPFTHDIKYLSTCSIICKYDVDVSDATNHAIVLFNSVQYKASKGLFRGPLSSS